VLWHQPALLFMVSLIPSAVALMFRCQGRGAPFATMASSVCSALTILFVSALAAASSLLTHQVPVLSGLPPVANALLVPWALCVGRLQGQRDTGITPQSRSIYWVIATAGCVLLLRRLDKQMSMDKYDWVKGEEGWDTWDPDELAIRSMELARDLGLLAAKDASLCKKITSDRSLIKRKLAIARKADSSSDEHGEAMNAARVAYLNLRGRAYDEGYRRRFEPAPRWRGLKRGAPLLREPV
jgi:hypothetical protein